MARRCTSRPISSALRTRIEALFVLALAQGPAGIRELERRTFALMSPEDQAALSRSGSTWAWGTSALGNLRRAGKARLEGQTWSAPATAPAADDRLVGLALAVEASGARVLADLADGRRLVRRFDREAEARAFALQARATGAAAFG